MGVAAATLLLLLADGADAEFLALRVQELSIRYEQVAARQSAEAVQERAAVVREIAHLPFEGEPRERAGRLLARIVSEDRAYRVRAEAARAIGRIGTPGALAAMYRALFGVANRDGRFELLYAVLPEALAGLRHPDDMEWVAKEVLRPSAGSGDRGVPGEAGPLRRELVTLTLEGLALARVRALAPEIAPLARAKDPGTRAAALAALVALESGEDLIEEALADPDERVRAAALGSPRLPAGHALAALEDDSPLVRGAAARALAARPDAETVTRALERFRARETHGSVRLDLVETLRALTGKDFAFDGDLWADWWSVARDGYEGPVDEKADGRTYFFSVGLRTERVIFVIDVSASMARADAEGVSRLSHAARELERAISRLPPGSRFCLYTFAAQVGRWPGDRDEYGDRTQAAAAVADLLERPPAGATNTYAALLTALEDPFDADTIVLLTDGNPYRCSFRGKTYAEHEQILHEVRRANEARRARIHAVALLSGARAVEDAEDAAAAASFLRRLTAAHRGEFREVR